MTPNIEQKNEGRKPKMNTTFVMLTDMIYSVTFCLLEL